MKTRQSAQIRPLVSKIEPAGIASFSIPARAEERFRPSGNCRLLGTFAVISVRRIYVARGRDCETKGRRGKKEEEEAGRESPCFEIAFIALSEPIVKLGQRGKLAVPRRVSRFQVSLKSIHTRLQTSRNEPLRASARSRAKYLFRRSARLAARFRTVCGRCRRDVGRALRNRYSRPTLLRPFSLAGEAGSLGCRGYKKETRGIT